MAEYTTEVRSICEFYAGLKESVGQNQVIQIIERSRDKIFNFPYPMFDENYKSVLESKILSHYYTREISEETVGLWQLRLYAKMNEIMPKYNKLYELEAKKINPLATIWKETQGNKKGNKEETDNRDIFSTGANSRNYSENDELSGSETKGSNKSTNTIIGETDTTTGENKTTYDNLKEKTDNLDKYHDTPQSQADIMDEGYLTNVRDVENTKVTTGGFTETPNETTTKNANNTETENGTESLNRNANENRTHNENGTTSNHIRF